MHLMVDFRTWLGDASAGSGDWDGRRGRKYSTEIRMFQCHTSSERGTGPPFYPNNGEPVEVVRCLQPKRDWHCGWPSSLFYRPDKTLASGSIPLPVPAAPCSQPRF